MEPIIDEFGTKRWLNNKGQFHRENGPAVIFPDGSKEYWAKGQPLTEKQFNAWRKQQKLQ